MNLKPFIPLIVAILLGVVAAKIAYNVAHKKTASAPVSHGIQVVVARGVVAPGSELTSDELMLAPIAGDATPAKAFTTQSDVVGRVVTTPLVEGQPVLQDFLAPKGTAAGLSSLIPVGMRAMTIDVNDTSGMAGMLAPGCHVDVVSTVSGTNDTEKPITRVICQNILITAVGQRLSPTRPDGDKDSSYHTVTLIASLREVEMIELATTSARTRLILRAHNDNDSVDNSDGVTQVELRGRSRTNAGILPVALMSNPAATTRPAERTGYRVEIIRGGQSSWVDIGESVSERTPMPIIPTTLPSREPTQVITGNDYRPAIPQ